MAFAYFFRRMLAWRLIEAFFAPSHRECSGPIGGILAKRNTPKKSLPIKGLRATRHDGRGTTLRHCDVE